MKKKRLKSQFELRASLSMEIHDIEEMPKSLPEYIDYLSGFLNDVPRDKKKDASVHFDGDYFNKISMTIVRWIKETPAEYKARMHRVNIYNQKLEKRERELMNKLMEKYNVFQLPPRSKREKQRKNA